MNMTEINELTSKESKEKAEQSKANQQALAASMAQAYARLFKTDDGQKVLQDLSQKYFYNNAIDMESRNIDYRAAFANGEAEVIKQIINNMQSAEVI